jgi:hypothetical protein
MPTISLTSRTVSLIWSIPAWAERLRSTPVLISVVKALASRVSSPRVEAIWLVARVVSELFHLGRDDREAAPGISCARRLDGGVER